MDSFILLFLITNKQRQTVVPKYFKRLSDIIINLYTLIFMDTLYSLFFLIKILIYTSFSFHGLFYSTFFDHKQTQTNTDKNVPSFVRACYDSL